MVAKQVTAPMGLAGCCVGSQSVVGLGVSVAAGRMIPRDVSVVAEPSGTLLKIPANVNGICAIKDGTLISI